MVNIPLGSASAGESLNLVLKDLVDILSIIDLSQLKLLLANFGVVTLDIDSMNADLKAADSKIELIEFTSNQLPGIQVAILTHGQNHDPSTLLFIAEEACRPDLLNLE